MRGSILLNSLKFMEAMINAISKNIKVAFGGTEKALFTILVQAHKEIHIGDITTNNQINMNTYSNLSRKGKLTIFTIDKVAQGKCCNTS